MKEARIEEELYHLLRTVLAKHANTINGVAFGEVCPQCAVNGGTADLLLSLADGKPFMVIECKRKTEAPEAPKTIRDFDPLGSRVINQALTYAARLGAPMLATTNGEFLALFRTPSPGEAFRLDTHRLAIREVRLREQEIEAVLDFATRWYTKQPVRLIEIDWLFISRLRTFVNFLAAQLREPVRKLREDTAFAERLALLQEQVGPISSEQLARETAYSLMNKIVFYKVLERHYETLPKLKSVNAPNGRVFVEILNGYFQQAVAVTGDFEPVFLTGIYANIPVPDSQYVFDDINAFIDDMSQYQLESIGSDVVGHVYEELIPDEERHRLGQFYTPPPIAELIVRWAVRTPQDTVFDPAVGSGTFLVKAYKRLVDLTREKKKRAVHDKVLSQLYATDINPFAAHLTAVNLAMRNVRNPTSKMNVLVEDFFNLRPRLTALTPGPIKTMTRETKGQIALPSFSAVVANPPYTRWVEIPDKTQHNIMRAIGDLLKKYRLTGGIGTETGIYAHFLMFAREFLEPDGRIGMIISNSWLQAEYGTRFAKYLLDHFKVKAVIDFNQRLFRIPLVATCVLLLEQETNQRRRQQNQVVFLYVEKEASVDDLLDAIRNPAKPREGILTNVVPQTALAGIERWIGALFDTEPIRKRIFSSPSITSLGSLFEPRYANLSGIEARGGTGADKFFYLARTDVAKWGLEKYVGRLIVSPRYAKYYTLGDPDWARLQTDDKVCHVFLCHEPMVSLPDYVRAFIGWGETTPLVRVKTGGTPPTASESMASRSRAQNRKTYAGWYDLGVVLQTLAFTSRRAQYHHRFSKAGDSFCFDESFICFLPRPHTKLSEEATNAVLAFLNSSFTRLFVELFGRSTAGGTIELDTKSASQLPIIDVTKLDRRTVSTLGKLFEKLEAAARCTDGIDTQQGLAQVQPTIDAIDETIATAIGLEETAVQQVKKLTALLAERRISRKESAVPEAVRGEEEPRIRHLRQKKEKRGSKDRYAPLTSWFRSPDAN